MRHPPGRPAGRSAGAGHLRHRPDAPRPARTPAAGRRGDAYGGNLVRDPPVPGRARGRPAILLDIRETLPLYAEEGLVHPGTILHIGNWALRDNVVLGPWMHVGSRVEHFAAAKIGDELSAKALVTGNYERRAHRFVDLDVLVYANRTAPVARIAHLAIYRPRQLAAA